MWDGKTVKGPIKLKVDAPLDTIPVYLKPGAVVPVQLCPELQFGRSMTGRRVDAVIVTFSNRDKEVSMLNTRGEAARVTVRAGAGGTGWKLENLPEMNYLLVYGTASAASVKLDGAELPRVETGDLDSMPIGWVTDPTGNRLVIHLPSRGVENSAPTMEIQVIQAGQ